MKIDPCPTCLRDRNEALQPQSESEKFFAHLNNGEVWLRGSNIQNGFNVVITSKAGDSN